MRYSLAFVATIAVATATTPDSTKTPCGNLCGNGAAPSSYFTTSAGNQYAVCPDTDFSGHRIAGDPTRSDVADVQSLGELCDQVSDCVAGTLSGGFGYLKDAVPLPYGTADPSGANDSIFKVDPSCQPGTTTTTSAQATTTSAQGTTTSAQATTTSAQGTTTSAQATTTSAQVTTTSKATTVSTTTTKSATTSASATPSCPADKDIVQIGGKYFYKYYSGSGYRNSFKYDDWLSISNSYSKDEATLKCGSWISSNNKWAPCFQVFQYFDTPNSWSWHCDASVSLNFDLNFSFKDKWTQDICQYVPVPDNCKTPPKVTTTVKATPTPAPSPWKNWYDQSQCPKWWNVKVGECDGKKYYFTKVVDTTCKRNSFQYNWYTTFDPRKMSWNDAVEACADYAAGKASKSVQKRTGDQSKTWPAFQLFYYKSDRLYHCDTSATENVDFNFKPSSDVDAIEQWNKVDPSCKYNF